MLAGDTHAFTRALAHAAQDRQAELDELISRYAEGWSLERIAPVERSILRVGLLEMLHPDAVPGEQPIPAEGAIDEAVETAKRFCGADAPKFVNGILGAVLRAAAGSGVAVGDAEEKAAGAGGEADALPAPDGVLDPP